MPKNNYVISLKKAHDNKPRTRRANYAIREIYNFLKKHTRKERNDILLSEGVNNAVWKNSIQRPPRKIEVSLKFKDEKVYVFLKDSKALQEFGKVKTSKETKKTIKTTTKKEIVKKTDVKTKIETKATKEVVKESAVETETEVAKETKEIKKENKE